MTGFGDRLSEHVARRESQIVLGLDPDPARLWPAITGAVDATTPQALAGAAVTSHCRALIDAAGPACVAIKPQLACFERLGAPGAIALGETVSHAQDNGLLVIADGKRGDVPVSAHVYAQALVGSTPSPFGDVAGLGADAITANPLMGRDSLMPLVETARAGGAGVFVLVRTSNPGASDVEDLELANGQPLWRALAALVDEMGSGSTGSSGLDDVGAVVGATVPEHIAQMRESMPRAVFLLPGVGAQGGRVEDLAPAWEPGRAAGLVTASRSIAAAHEQSGGDPAQSARAEAERLRESAWSLAG